MQQLLHPWTDFRSRPVNLNFVLKKFYVILEIHKETFMKPVIYCLSLFLTVTAFAKEGRKPAAQRGDLYLVESMTCTGKINKKPDYMHTDYVSIAMKFTSFQSKRKDGSVADSLEIRYKYTGQKLAKPDFENLKGVWFASPLRKIGDEVYRDDMTGHDEDLELKVTSTDSRDGKTIENLVGTWNRGDGRPGGYLYNLECQANVVQKVSRIDDRASR